MAAGEPRSGPRGTASQSPVNQPPVQQDQRKAEAVRTALWALGVTILSNVANILKQLRDVVESVVQLQAFVRDHIWASAVLLSVVVVWGNVLLFRFLYYRLKRRISATYKVLTSIGCLIVVAAVFATNLFSIRSLLQDPVQVQRQLVSELTTVQAIEGGFRNTTTPEGVQDTWTTAQSVKAMLLAGTYSAGRIKQAFSYIESQRQNDGFNVISGSDAKAFIRTEVAAWVTVAYLESLSKSELWTNSEHTKTIGLVETTLQIIVSQQDRVSGGWGPIPHSAIAHERTYATMMAVWALTEALLSEDVSNQTKESLLPAFDAGVSWLMSHYVSNLGWEENPRYALGKAFPGLTYQVIFVLERAQLVSKDNSFRNTEAYMRVKREIRNTIHVAQVGDLTSVPTNYIQVGEYPCWADVLAYPWLLSILPILIADPDVPADDRRFLRGLLRDELSKVRLLPNQLLQVETWQLAEHLIGVSNFINSQRKQN